MDILPGSLYTAALYCLGMSVAAIVWLLRVNGWGKTGCTVIDYHGNERGKVTALLN